MNEHPKFKRRLVVSTKTRLSSQKPSVCVRRYELKLAEENKMVFQMKLRYYERRKMSSNFLKFHVSCKTENQLTSLLGIIPNKEIFNDSPTIQKSVHYRE